MVYNIDHIHHLLNRFKMLIFVFNSLVYIIYLMLEIYIHMALTIRYFWVRPWSELTISCSVET